MLLRRIEGACALALLTLALAGPAAAQSDEDNPVVIAAHWFDRSDLDKDGYLTVQELQSGRPKQFRRVDGNGDGWLTSDEYRYGIPSNRQAEVELMSHQFSASDVNGDGALTEDEFMAYAQTIVAAGDTDGDGRLTLEEFTDAFLNQ